MSPDSTLYKLHSDIYFAKVLSLAMLVAVALPVVLKVEFNFVVILYITILVLLSPGSCFKSAIRYQNSISKHTDRNVIRGC